MRYSSEITFNEELILNALQGAAAIVNEEGILVIKNNKWCSSTGGSQWLTVDLEYNNYFEHCEKMVEEGNDYALKIIIGLRKVLEGERESFEISIPFKCDTENNWYRVTISSYGKSEGLALLIFEDITKSMVAARALRDSEERYSQQFKYSLFGIILASPDGTIFDVNPAACRILGYDRDELIDGGRSLIMDEQNPINVEAQRIRAETSVFEGEKEYIRKDGSKIVAEVSSVLYRNSGSELRSINTFRDKTEEKETVMNLKEEKRFNKTAINSVPGIFFLLDSDKKLIRHNDAFLKDLGFSEDEINNRHALDFIADADTERVDHAINDIFESGTGHIIASILTKTNSPRVYHLYANRFESNGETYLVGTGIDITDLVRSEQQRENNYEMMSQLFNNSPLAMVKVNLKGEAVKINEGFTTLFGFNGREILGENVNKLICSGEEFKEAEQYTALSFQGELSQTETIRQTKNGENRSVLVNTVPVTSNGNVIAVYGIYVDLTDQKLLEKKIQKSLKEKEILLQEVHHRVKNNLAVIAGLLDLQIMEETEPQIERKLNEVRSRIFSIAKIHETLYKEENVINIRFDKYLKTITESNPQAGIDGNFVTQLELRSSPVSLNLNQAVPFGLIINEIMNLLLLNDHTAEKIQLNLSASGDNVTFSIEGDDLDISRLEISENSESFQEKLVEILLNQINGTLELKSGNSRRAIIQFQKADTRGSSSSVINESEFEYNS